MIERTEYLEQLKRFKNQFGFLNKTVLVVKTSSMSYKNEANPYLDENNLNDQFEAFDLIVVNKLPEEKDIKQ